MKTKQQYKQNSHFRARYGINVEQYEELVIKQNGKCDVCKQTPKDGGKGNANARLFIDHDHKTGNIRGLLCQPCNAALGMAQDNPETLRELANYLEKEPAIKTSEMVVKDKGSWCRNKTNCPLGHLYNEENTYVDNKNGYRQCKICRKNHDTNRQPRTS